MQDKKSAKKWTRTFEDVVTGTDINVYLVSQIEVLLAQS